MRPTARYDTYEIRFLPSVRKDLRGLPQPAVRRILNAIDRLADDPRPPNHSKLTGHDLYRIRVGVYRVVYEVHDRELVILVVREATAAMSTAPDWRPRRLLQTVSRAVPSYRRPRA